MIKYSRQRESIVNFLASRTDHPTAETIYQNIKKEFPNISLGTVYRNLSLLEEIGEIIKISTGVGPDHYDYNTAPHYHFICRGCGKKFTSYSNKSRKYCSHECYIKHRFGGQ